jgi:type II secretory pathway component GspD/PulD (secretin)
MPSPPKPASRQRSTTKKREQPPSPDGQPEQPKDIEPVANPQPENVPPAPQPMPPSAEPAPNVQSPSPATAEPPPAEAQPPSDQAKRIEDARKAAAERAAARRARAAGQGADPNAPAAPGATPPTMPMQPEHLGDGATDPGLVTPINIAPAQTNVPPEERKYGFSIKDGTYEQLIEGFARQTGLGVIGEAPKEGKVTFITTEELTFEQALSRVRMLLFNYKPHEPYWIERTKDGLRIIRVTDIYRILREDQMFGSVDDFRAAKVPADQLVLVIYTPKTGSVSDLQQVRDFLPDYVRVTPLLDQNRVTIFALASDIEKYLWLIDFFAARGRDPRVLEKIEVHHIMANDALTKLRSLMDLDSAGGGVKGAASAPRAGRTPREPSPLDNMPEPAVSVIADDAQGVLIVRAMQDKIDEIKLLLPIVDVDTAGPSPTPVIIKVQHVDANEMISTIQQVLSSAGTAPGTPTPPKPKKGKRTASATPPASSGEGLSADAVTLLRHPSDNAIIVLADEAGVAKVRELVLIFDTENRLKPVRIPLAHADANEALNTVNAVLGTGGAKGAPERFGVVVDPAGDSLWFNGTEKDLERVQEVIAIVDLPDAPLALRTYIAVYQQPSFLANMLREFDSTNPASAAPAGATKKPKTKRATAAAPPSKFTPDDAQRKLFIICTDDEWVRYQGLLKELDKADDSAAHFVKIPVQHIDPAAAIERLSSMMDLGSEENVRFVPGNGAILAIGANPSEIERARVFLIEVDQPTALERRTFEIRHADPADIKAAIEALVTDVPVNTTQTSRRKGKGEKAGVGVTSTTSSEMTIVEMGRRLIVHTTPSRMEQVAALIEEFDVPEAKTELKVYSDFPPGTNIEAISETVSSVFSSTAKVPRKGGKGEAGADEPRFIPQPASGRLVVIADPSAFPEIERLLTVLRHDVASQPPVVTFINVLHADAADLVEIIQPLLDIKIRGLIAEGELGGENVEEAVPSTKPGKRRGMITPAGSSDRYHLSPDPRNKRIVIAAPQVVVDQAKALVAQFDIPGDKPIFKTVELANADPTQMVSAVKEMMGRPAVPRRTAGAKTPKAGAASTPAVELLGEGELLIVEAPSGGAIILHGPASEVARAEEWIAKLDAMSTRGRTIKVYDVKNADMDKLFDLVVNVVGTAGASPGKTPKARGKKDEDDDEVEFTTSRTHTGQDLYIQADVIGKTMMVAATPSKIAQIDDIVDRIDKDVEIVAAMKPDAPVPNFVYDLEHAEALDASFELETVLESVWKPKDQVPKVEAAAFGNSLMITYPDESRFDEIRDYIRRYADKPDEDDIRVIRKSFTPPPGLSASQAAAWLKTNHPEFSIELENKGPEEEKTFSIERLQPFEPSAKVNPCVLPGEIARQLALHAASQTPPEDEAAEQQEQLPEEEPVEEPVIVPSDDLIRQAVKQKDSRNETKDKPKTDAKSADKPKDDKPEKKKSGTGERLKVYYDDTAGVFVVEGRSIDIEEVDDWIGDLKEEIEDFPVKPDIRIYRVRYIDVYTAQDILEEMFNLTKQQQAAMNAQQQAAMRQQQQQARQGQMGQGRAQPQGDQQPGGPGQAGGPAGPGGRLQAQQQAAQQQMAMAQVPQAGVRIYPNPRDRTLILRAETSQYPQILELLATIDQPKPIDSEMRTYPLKNLNAAEVEDILREMLGVGKDGGRSRARPPAQPGAPGGGLGGLSGPGESLPQTILQETVTGASKLGVDPEDIKLFSSEISNTVMAVAPKAALDFIGEVIKKLESEDIPQRITKYYELKHADADEAADHLASHFEEGRTSGKSRKAAGDGGAAATGAKGLNMPSFIAYPRLNLLTVHGTQAQLDEVDKLVQRIDVKGEQDQWEHLTLAHADAKVVADTLTQMFGEKGKGEGAKAKGGAVPKFLGEAGGGIVLYSAPASLRQQIQDTVKRLEEQHKETRTPRIIELKNARPTAVAEAIDKAFEVKQSGGKSAPARFTITGHDPTRRIFVIADDETFQEVSSLVKLLDDKPGGIGAEFRIYPMQYASAKAIHAQLTKLLRDYLQRLGSAGADAIEAFSVEPDELSNSLIVLGSPTVFGFIEENLRKIDTPAMKAGQPASLIVPLSNTNAQEVAGNIQKMYTGKEQPLGVTPPQVDANPATNTLIIRGTQAQIDEIKRDIIDPLEAQDKLARQVQHKTYKLKFADLGSIQDAINKLFRSDSKNPRDQVQAVPEYTSNSVIVSASPENHKRVEDLLAQVDSAEVSQQDVRVVEIKHADAASVAQTLTEIYVRAGARQSGNQPPPITIASVQGSRAILIKSKPEDFARIQETIKTLDTDVVGTGGEVRVVTLLYSDAAEVNTALQEYLRKPGGSGGRGGDLTGGVRLSAMPQSNSIVVSGAKEELDRLESIIKGMDIAGEKGSVPQIIPLKYITAGLILPSLQQVFTEQRGAQRRNQVPPVIVADEGSNAIIVRASPSDLTAIKDMIASLDTEDKKDKSRYRIVRVKSGINVTDLAEQIESSLNESAKAQAGSARGAQVPSLLATPDTRTNTITLAGSPTMFDDAEAMIKKIEELGPSGDAATRIVKVSNVKVDQIQKMIDQLTQDQGSGQRGGGRPRPQRSRP